MMLRHLRGYWCRAFTGFCCVQVKESKKKRIHAIKSQWRMKKKEEEQSAKQVSAVNLLQCSLVVSALHEICLPSK
jgi:hypothetical protein